MSIVKRQIENSLLPLLPKYPILAVTGPRQSGKTTLLRNILPDYQYVSLENTDERNFANTDPNGFLKKYCSNVIFDEVQLAPNLFPYLKTIVDESKQMGQFILSGSQNFHLLERITQSLGDSVAIFKLLPFDSSEIKADGLLTDDWKALVINGFYPAIFDRELDPAVFYFNYLQTYIDRDIISSPNVQDKGRFRNFISLCAGRTGQLLNLNNLANECGISQPTAKSWLSILENSYILFQLQPYFENFNKRIVKTPKLYFYDVGLASFLLGLRTTDDLDDQTLAGGLFENLVIADIFKKNHHQYLLKEYWFWRDSNGNEVDLMTKQGRYFDIFEIKSTQTVLPKLFKGMEYFSEITGGKTKTRTMIYGGKERFEGTEYLVRRWDDG